MIDIRDGELYDILRFSAFADDVDAQCFSCALKRGLDFIFERLHRIQTHSDIEAQPEATIDALAAEFRAPYYDQALPLDVKRQLVKSAIVWHYHAGTPSAVKEVLNVVFGDGNVIEWFDFDDFGSNPQPFTFDLVTNAPLNPATRNQLLTMIDRVKNVRSHLRELRYERNQQCDVRYGFSALRVPTRISAAGALNALRYTVVPPHYGVSTIAIQPRHALPPRRISYAAGKLCGASTIAMQRRHALPPRRTSHATGKLYGMSAIAVRPRASMTGGV